MKTFLLSFFTTLLAIGLMMVVTRRLSGQKVPDFAAVPSLAIDTTGRVKVMLYCVDGRHEHFHGHSAYNDDPRLWTPCKDVGKGVMRGRMTDGTTFEFVAE